MQQMDNDRRLQTMNFYEAIYKIAREDKKSVNDIGTSIGKTDRYVTSGKSRKSNPVVTNAAKMLNVCGYALCAVKRDEVTDSMLEID